MYLLSNILTVIFLSVYLHDLISSISISYGVNSYSIGGRLSLVNFLSVTPSRNCRITNIHKRAYIENVYYVLQVVNKQHKNCLQYFCNLLSLTIRQ